MLKAGGLTDQVIVFNLAEQIYGVNISNVLEIIRPDTITKVPGSLDFIEGIIKLRGQVIPVLDLAGRFGLKRSANNNGNSRIIILETGGITVGIIVDNVTEVLQLQQEQVKPLPEITTGLASSCLKGVALVSDSLIIIIDAGRILFDEEKNEIKQMAV